MSDLSPHSRDDLNLLPCDVEPAPHACNCTPYLCPVCRPRRSLLRAQLEVSAQRLLRPTNVVSMAEARRRKRS